MNYESQLLCPDPISPSVPKERPLAFNAHVSDVPLVDLRAKLLWIKVS